MDVGFVGTGNMGGPMAGNLLAAGHRLTVFDLRAEATAALEEQGATRAPDLPSLAASVEVVLLSLPDARAVEAAVLGSPTQPGLVAGSRAGSTVFDLSTVGPDSTRRLAARGLEEGGVRLVDAPVSGSVAGARAGTLAIMFGATAEEVAPFEPVFRAIGTSFFHLGELGRGNVLKLLNNYVAISTEALLAEAMTMADSLGVPRRTVAEVMEKSSAASFMLDRKREALVTGDYRPGFLVDLAAKDLGLAVDLAEQSDTAVTVGREAWHLLRRAQAAGLGTQDCAAVLEVLAGRAGSPPAAEPAGTP
jgi:3-hydroxyisobutyrate dehydrogenase-like beta-hydroxyacid dehydrogenase